MSFEKSIERLEEIAELMEKSDTSIEKSVELYKEGIELSAYCSEVLEEAEKEVKELSKSLEGKFFEKDFGGQYDD